MGGRAVKAVDSKSTGILPRVFESRPKRFWKREAEAGKFFFSLFFATTDLRGNGKILDIIFFFSIINYMKMFPPSGADTGAGSARVRGGWGAGGQYRRGGHTARTLAV